MTSQATGSNIGHVFRLLRLIKKVAQLFGDRQTPKSAKALLLVAALYALFPADLIPEWVPVLGVMDDLGIVMLLVGLALRLVPAEVKRRYGLLR